MPSGGLKGMQDIVRRHADIVIKTYKSVEEATTPQTKYTYNDLQKVLLNSMYVESIQGRVAGMHDLSIRGADELLATGITMSRVLKTRDTYVYQPITLAAASRPLMMLMRFVGLPWATQTTNLLPELPFWVSATGNRLTSRDVGRLVTKLYLSEDMKVSTNTIRSQVETDAEEKYESGAISFQTRVAIAHSNGHSLEMARLCYVKRRRNRDAGAANQLFTLVQQTADRANDGCDGVDGGDGYDGEDGCNGEDDYDDGDNRNGNDGDDGGDGYDGYGGNNGYDDNNNAWEEASSGGGTRYAQRNFTAATPPRQLLPAPTARSAGTTPRSAGRAALTHGGTNGYGGNNGYDDNNNAWEEASSGGGTRYAQRNFTAATPPRQLLPAPTARSAGRVSSFKAVCSTSELPKRHWGSEHPSYGMVGRQILWSTAELNYVGEFITNLLDANPRAPNVYSQCLKHIKLDVAATAVFHAHHVVSSDRVKNGYISYKKLAERQNV